MTLPHEVVVVVPWGGERLDLLLRQIARLVGQDIDGALEIRVAANRDVPSATRTEILARSTDRRAVVLVDAAARPGASFARNRGATPAAPILLFCDADDEVRPAWAREMRDALHEGADVVGGALEYESLNETPFALSRATELPVAFRHRAFSPSASLGITAVTFAELGGFDEALLSGEDIDLCWRAQYAGRTIAFVPRAIVDYRLRQTWSELFDQGRRYGSSDLDLYARHRVYGLRRSPVDSAGELARVAGLLVLAARGRRDRLKLAVKLGTVFGHLQGSVRHRTLFL